MKYTKEERLDIGRRIYQGEITLAAAATIYDINLYTARDYLRLYKASENISIPGGYRTGGNQEKPVLSRTDTKLYERMSRQELMEELIKVKTELAKAQRDMN